MAYTAPSKASYQFVFRRIVKFLGIASPNDTTGDTIISASPFPEELIKAQIIQSDYEVNCLIAATENNGYRSTFFTEPAVEVLHGANIPGYIGSHGGVEITSGDDTKTGRLANNLGHLDRTRSNFAFYGSPMDLYYIENGKMYLADPDAVANVLLPQIPVATGTPPVLVSPLAYQNAVIGHAISTIFPVGADSGHRQNWSQIWAAYAQMIMGNAGSLPDPERMQRISI